MPASSPEELETLLEDALLLGDPTAATALFEPGAVFLEGARFASPERGLSVLGGLGYIAAARAVTVRPDLAIALGDQVVNISSRSPDGGWRLVAVVLHLRQQGRASPSDC